MTTEYTTRIGTSKRKGTVGAALYRLPTRERPDDGKILLHVGDWNCPCTCGRGGTLMWAEAGYVAWHRICNACGSHWDLHPWTLFVSGDADAEIPVLLSDRTAGRLRPVDDDLAILSLNDAAAAATLRKLLALVRADEASLIAKARAEAHGGIPTIGACW